MAVAIFKTFIPGEVLTASDLNSSLLQILNNGDALASPATTAHDMNGFGLIMDADGDSKIISNTNNRLDIYLGGVLLFELDGTVASPVNALALIASATLVAPQITARGSDTDISINLVPKGAGTVQINGITLNQSGDNILAIRTFA